MSVIIGVDPHKASHTAVAVDSDETELAGAKGRATRNQVPQLLSWAEPLGERTWAIESASAIGYLLSQQLVAAGVRARRARNSRRQDPGAEQPPHRQERPQRPALGRRRRAT